MRKGLAIALLLLAAACGGEQPASSLSRQPVSVRGWIQDVDSPTSGTGDFKTVETEAARRLAMFQQTSAYIEGAPYASGGVSEAGSFVLLDVPPGNVTISFNAPGAENAQLVLQNLPPNADVLIPGLVLKPGGSSLALPDKVLVRIPGSGGAAKPSGAKATIAGQPIPIMEVPLRELENRRDYPDPGGLPAPVATVK